MVAKRARLWVPNLRGKASRSNHRLRLEEPGANSGTATPSEQGDDGSGRSLMGSNHDDVMRSLKELIQRRAFFVCCGGAGFVLRAPRLEQIAVENRSARVQLLECGEVYETSVIT